jgi:hypothetical protein
MGMNATYHLYSEFDVKWEGLEWRWGQKKKKRSTNNKEGDELGS